MSKVIDKYEDPEPISITPYQLAERFIGVKEVPGTEHNPQILAMLGLDNPWAVPQGDEISWCSAFVNYIQWLLRLPRTKSLAARSWLSLGQPIKIDVAAPAFDIVVLHRGPGTPNPNQLHAPGHVGYFSGAFGGDVYILGGNQSGRVSVAPFPKSMILGIRRIL